MRCSPTSTRRGARCWPWSARSSGWSAARRPIARRSPQAIGFYLMATPPGFRSAALQSRARLRRAPIARVRVHMRFDILARSGRARRGQLWTPHGIVETPAFMPVGTLGSVKSLHPVEVSGTGARLLIANTYHLWLRPGAELVAEHGGLH